jgi:hypothetical protein
MSRRGFRFEFGRNFGAGLGRGIAALVVALLAVAATRLITFMSVCS